MTRKHRPGIEESRTKRSKRSLDHILNMREAYIDIVRERLADPTIKEAKKMSFVAIAKRLTDQKHTAPHGGKITYKIARRLCEIVGVVEPLDIPPQVQKTLRELEVGDCVRVISAKRAYFGEVGIVRRVADDRRGFLVELRMRSSKLYAFFAEEVEHLPDDRVKAGPS
ncbi:hypothetical protein LC612_29530 [Nostoc sp. CHAB 5834]|nr:hypothetical protein [Nostoc sp. CHAB 5834]